MNPALTGKNIIVTGASRGLGIGLARTLWQRGANLLLAARSEDRLAALQTELMSKAQTGQEAHIVVVDLKLPDSISTISAQAVRIWNQIDVLLNNAAILGPIGRAWESGWEEWQSTIRVNLLAPIELCRDCVPRMIERRRGKIINISGGGASAPRPNFSAYATAKAGLIRFSEILAHEVYDMNIQVNCVAPGPMPTGMLQSVLHAGPEAAGWNEYTRAIKQAQSDSGLPERALELCAFLASAASDGVTGRLISAVWDPWERLPEHVDDLRDSDIYTLRRIVPQERGKDWG